MKFRHYSTFIAQYGTQTPLNWLAPFSLFIVDQGKLMQRLGRHRAKMQLKMAHLYGEQHAFEYTKMLLAQIVSMIALCFFLSGSLTLIMGGDVTLLYIGALFSVLLPFVLLKHVDQQIERRKRAMILELPLFLNKITLLINAGETVQKALIRAIEQASDQEEHPFYKELQMVLKQLDNNYSFQQALEEFSRRCGVQEVSIFTNTILLNYRRGGSDLTSALRSLAHQLWAARKTMAKTLGEEASAKLVIPLVIIFVVVMIVVGAPAIMMMNF